MSGADDAAMAEWPRMTLCEVEAELCAKGARFEMETVDVRGLSTRVWKNALPDMAALVAHCEAHADRAFIVFEKERLSYRGFVKAVASLALHLSDLGIGAGDRVALAMRNLPEWPVAYFAAAATGAIVVPLNAWWTGPELEYALRDSGARALLCDAERRAAIAPLRQRIPGIEHLLVVRDPLAPPAERLETLLGRPDDYAALADRAKLRHDFHPDDDVSIFYTSGTTGSPKGAVATHRNLLSNILSSAFANARGILRRGAPLPAPRQRIALHVIPFFHVTGFCARLLGAIYNGDTLILMRKWDAEEAFGLIERERADSAGGVPTIAWQLLEHPARRNYDLSSLELVSYGGAPAAPELARRIAEEFGAAPGFGWGMSETCATVTNHSAEDYLARPDSCGPAVAVADLMVTDEHGTALPPGSVGELRARGPMVVRRYWNRPEESEATFRDGWVLTGDIARLDEDGFCYIVDRAKDVVIRGGENIYASEVENALFAFPGVTDAALIGLPDAALGEVPAAVVHLAAGTVASETSIQAWLRSRLAAFKVPVVIRFSDTTLPRNANGKILKRELLAMFGTGEAPVPAGS
ncbi:class I adenylate-forming enzyme family protein [Sphingopyxis sp. R3-92]|uniref:class I adenylate-forming enzyme family protein n=1 Tax=Sphingopyxis sp. R3-92 TaxID=3158553 RepID=UPI003EE7D0C4